MQRENALLCELHAHSTWSDGTLELTALVDLYGSHGFDVLCVTDHALPASDPWLLEQQRAGVARHVNGENHPRYLSAIDAEAERARSRYGLLVLPGLELTYNSADPDLAAHGVAVGLRDFVSPDGELRAALMASRDAGAAVVAAHPHGAAPDAIPMRTTRRFWRETAELAPFVDRFELFNRNQVFGWVAEARLPVVASGDFHRPEHLFGWKTLLPCEKHSDAIVEHLRSPRPVYLAPYRADTTTAAQAA